MTTAFLRQATALCIIWMSSVPTITLALSTGDSAVGGNHRDKVQQQLGYLPSNFVSVSAWKANGKDPVAIQTYPLNGGAKRRQAKALESFGAPFPTLFWLTSPDIARAIGDLERTGYIGVLERKMQNDADLSKRLLLCHKLYAAQRWDSLTSKDRSMLPSDDPNSSVRSMRAMLKHSGISGLNYAMHCHTVESSNADDDINLGEANMVYIPTIKCLHTHYAHFRSQPNTDATINPVGEIVHAHLMEQYPELEL